MSMRYKGAVLSAVSPITSSSQAIGVWTTRNQLQAIGNYFQWPVSINIPDPPIIGTVSLDSTGLAATIPFTAPVYNGGLSIISYTANSSTGNLSGTVAQSGSGSTIVTGLTANTNYTFTVYGSNPAGRSFNSSVSNIITSAELPGPPIIGTVTTAGRSAIIPVTIPASNGRSEIISYTANSSTGNLSGTIVQSGNGSITVTGLVRNTNYTFTAYDTNSVGRSINSSLSNSVSVQYFDDFQQTSPNFVTVNGYVRSYTSRNIITSSGKFIHFGTDESGVYSYFTSTSTNGSTWTNLVPATGFAQLYWVYRCHAVRSSDGLIVMCVDLGTISSTDGITWGNYTTSGENINSIAVKNSNGLFVGVGTDLNGFSWTKTSTDGIQWSAKAYLPYWNEPYSYGAYGKLKNPLITCRQSDGLFVIISSSNNNNPYSPESTLSTDGITWTAANVIIFASVRFHDFICRQSDGLFIAVGDKSDAAQYGVYTASTDGITWTNISGLSNTGIIERGGLTKVTVLSSGTFLATGWVYEEDKFYSGYATSTNGIIWTNIIKMNLTNFISYNPNIDNIYSDYFGKSVSPSLATNSSGVTLSMAFLNFPIIGLASAYTIYN